MIKEFNGTRIKTGSDRGRDRMSGNKIKKLGIRPQVVIDNLFDAYLEMLRDWKVDNLTGLKEFRAIGLDKSNKVVCKLAMTGFTDNVFAILDATKAANATKVIVGENAIFGSILPSYDKVALVEEMRTYGQKLNLQVVDQLIVSNNSYYSLMNTGF